MKYLDMPAGNDKCEAYDAFQAEVAAGRMVGLVPYETSDGETGLWLFSAHPEVEVTAENTYHYCVKTVMQARDKAFSENLSPLPRA